MLTSYEAKNTSCQLIVTVATVRFFKLYKLPTTMRTYELGRTLNGLMILWNQLNKCGISLTNVFATDSINCVR